MSIRCPKIIGVELEDFATGEITKLLSDIICEPCNRDSCDRCPGIAILGHLENQIGKQGIEEMKKLIKQFGKENL